MVTSLSFKKRLEFSQVNLIRLSAPKLQDDTRTDGSIRLTVPLRVVSCTIVEHLQAKAMVA